MWPLDIQTSVFFLKIKKYLYFIYYITSKLKFSLPSLFLVPHPPHLSSPKDPLLLYFSSERTVLPEISTQHNIASYNKIKYTPSYKSRKRKFSKNKRVPTAGNGDRDTPTPTPTVRTPRRTFRSWKLGSISFLTCRLSGYWDVTNCQIIIRRKLIAMPRNWP